MSSHIIIHKLLEYILSEWGWGQGEGMSVTVIYIRIHCKKSPEG